MRRQEIRLLALAKAGNDEARLEVGRRYLLGSDGFPRHVPTGIEYLTHPSVAARAEAWNLIAECLPLDDIVAAGLMPHLARAAERGHVVAGIKRGAWLLVREQQLAAASALFEAACAKGHPTAQSAWAAYRQPAQDSPLVALLKRLTDARMADGAALATAAAAEALSHDELQKAGPALQAAIVLSSVPAGVSGLVVDAVVRAERLGMRIPELEPERIEEILEAKATSGDATAAYALGRALCGIDLGKLAASAIATGQNTRKGAALLLRAADAGCDAAWLHLYRLHADNRLSVANPQMARFFLEKAAARGQAEAQRRLGALTLRTASTLNESEAAIGWLHQASMQGDRHAALLLKSLVLPLSGGDEEADQAIELLQQDAPWLAARLRISRAFGLTKLEALCFDPVSGMRPWGLVVGKNPFISQIRLSAPRAVPALGAEALHHLRAVAEFFANAGTDPGRYEGDLRRRSLNQRRAFAKHGLDEAMFFAAASSVALDSLRLGTKWAFRARQPLRLALAA